MALGRFSIHSAPAFYAIRADVVKQGCVMAARRSGMRQLGMLVQQGLQLRQFAIDHCIDSGLESADRTFARYGVGELRELIPRVESIFLRNHDLRVRHVEARGLHFVNGLSTIPWMHPLEVPAGVVVACLQRLVQALCLLLVLG